MFQAKILRQSCQNWLIGGQRYFLWRNIFLKNSNLFNNIWTLCKNSNILGRMFWQGCGNCLLQFRQVFLKENIHSTRYTSFLFTFRPGGKNVSFALRKTWARVVCTAFQLVKGTFCGKRTFVWSKSLITFGHWGEKFQSFPHFFWPFCENCIQCVQRNFSS